MEVYGRAWRCMEVHGGVRRRHLLALLWGRWSADHHLCSRARPRLPKGVAFSKPKRGGQGQRPVIKVWPLELLSEVQK